jgi:hypothetical protein
LDAATEILHHPRQADLFARWALYLLIGYEQSTLPPDQTALQWIVAQLLAALDAGHFVTIPDSADRPVRESAIEIDCGPGITAQPQGNEVTG